MQRRADAANAIGYALHSSRSHAAVIRVYDFFIQGVCPFCPRFTTLHGI
jgi:hypothetical protein